MFTLAKAELAVSARAWGVHFKIDGADTGGALSVVEHPFAVGALVRPHVHTREDEISIVLEGEIGFRSEDQEVVLRPGGYIIKPRNQVHAMWNAGTTPARMIEIVSDAGFEGFFRGFADLNDAGPIDLAAVADLAQEYGPGRSAEPGYRTVWPGTEVAAKAKCLGRFTTPSFKVRRSLFASWD